MTADRLSFPSWERGLKSNGLATTAYRLLVVPLVGTWIEMSLSLTDSIILPVVPLVGTWIEIIHNRTYNRPVIVVPLVGTWIEITENGI